MTRRSGQSGCVVKKGKMWHVRFYVDVQGQQQRQRRSVPIGPCKGKDKLTKPEAENKAKDIIGQLGVNTKEHLLRATNVSPIITFRQRVDWCRKNKQAWTKGKPGPIRTMESQLTKHILPRFGDLPLSDIDETKVQEFVADLERTTFDMRRPKGKTREHTGSVAKTYKLSRKTILNIVGVVKLVLGKKVWMTWELDLGKPEKKRQRYFTEDQMARIIDAAPGQYRTLFALLAGTGMRIGEAAGLHVDDLDFDNCVIHVRRGVFEGQELSPKTENAEREIDIDSTLNELLQAHLNGRRAGRVFEARNGSPVSSNNIRKRVLQPLLKRLEIPKAGLHAFRHSRVTVLRKNATPEDLQLQWIGHSSL